MKRDLDKEQQPIYMLKIKTKCNLSKELDKTQAITSSESRLNYMNEANKEA